MAQGTTRGVPIDTDPTLAADSDLLVPSQKAIKTYVDNSNVNQVETSRTISTTAPLSGGGDLSANRTLSITQATTGTDGYLSSTDWNTFNKKLPSDATVLGYNGLGSVIKGYPLGINLTAVGASTAFTNQRLWLIPVYVSADQTITGVKWLQIALGNYTANNYNGVGLYSVSGGTITLVASSTNNGNIWKTFTANTWGNQAFTTPYLAVRGTYFIGALYNNSAQTTAPSTGNVAIAAATVQSFDFTGGRMYSILATQLTLPASVALSTTTGVTTGWYFSLY
jgi:hypothetical protein